MSKPAQIPKTLGQLIFKYHEETKLSVKMLAELIGVVDSSSISDWELDAYAPSEKNLYKLIAVFFKRGVLQHEDEATRLWRLACEKCNNKGYGSEFDQGWFERLSKGETTLTEVLNDSHSLGRNNQPSQRFLRASYLPPKVEHFQGRSEILEWIKTRLADKQEKELPVLVRGWPGIGKSALFSQLAYNRDIQRAFPDGILWISLGPEPDLLELLARWWRRLGLDLSNYQEVEEVCATLRGELISRKILLLIDDVWEAPHAEIFKLGGPKSATIISTRLPDQAIKLVTRKDIYVLPVLNREEAFAMFRAWAEGVALQYEKECQNLLEVMERLPLGIKAAARLLERETYFGADTKSLILELTDGMALMKLETPDYDGFTLKGDNRPPPTIDFIFRKSTERLPEKLQAAFANLALFSFKPARFQLDLVAKTWREECEITNARATMTELFARGLVEQAEKNYYQMHALMYYHAASLLQTKYRK